MKFILLACGLLAASCAPTHPYTIADRETYNAIAPDFKGYVIADPLLTQEQKDLRLLTVETWRKRIEAAEGLPR